MDGSCGGRRCFRLPSSTGHSKVMAWGSERTRKDTIVRLPARSEAKHIEVMGDTGVGKTTLLIQMLSQIEDRDESAIVYDPAGEFIQRFYRENRGDIVLNPLDARSPYWSPSSELRSPAEARTIATSLYQPTSDKQGEFFTETPQKVFAHMMKYRPTPQELVEWMSDPEEIDRRVEGTELAAMISKDAPDQRNGVLGSLGLIADSLRLLPTREQAGEREWSATEWAEKRKGWIFLPGTKKQSRKRSVPLHSLWIDLLILRLLDVAEAWSEARLVCLDELATLQRLPQFHTALTKGRKSNNPIIFGYQGKAQLEVIYGHLAEVMLSQPATKIVMKTGEPKAAKWASELIGEIEIERMRETVADGKRAGKSFTLDRQIEPLVMSSEIEGLDGFARLLEAGKPCHALFFSSYGQTSDCPGPGSARDPGGGSMAEPSGSAQVRKTPPTGPDPTAASATPQQGTSISRPPTGSTTSRRRAALRTDRGCL